MSRRTLTTSPTCEILLEPEVAVGVCDNLKRKRQVSKTIYDKYAKLLPKLIIRKPVRPQPTNPKCPREKGSCVPKVGRNHKFIRRVLSKPQDQPQVTQPSAGKVPVQSDPESLSFQFSFPHVPDKDLENKEIQTNAISKVLFCIML